MPPSSASAELMSTSLLHCQTYADDDAGCSNVLRVSQSSLRLPFTKRHPFSRYKALRGYIRRKPCPPLSYNVCSTSTHPRRLSSHFHMHFHRKEPSTADTAKDSDAKDSDASQSKLSTLRGFGSELKRAISPFKPKIIEGGKYEANCEAFEAEMRETEANNPSQTAAGSSQRKTALRRKSPRRRSQRRQGRRPESRSQRAQKTPMKNREGGPA